jgi:hypothetical protein
MAATRGSDNLPKRPKRPRDPNQLAKLIVDISTGERQDAPKPNEARQKGGRQGGRARAQRLTPEQRQEIAKTAARARWKK